MIPGTRAALSATRRAAQGVGIMGRHAIRVQTSAEIDQEPGGARTERTSEVVLAGHHARDEHDAACPRDQPMAVTAEAALSIERGAAEATLRLRELLGHLAEDEGAHEVVEFADCFLGAMGDVESALSTLMRAGRESPRLALRAAVEASACAVGVWRTNLVEQVDELSLIDRDSLDAWSSLSRYSKMYVGAYLLPTLRAVRDLASCEKHGGFHILACVRDVEASIAYLNGVLARRDHLVHHARMRVARGA
jgi:hypothetical protein